MNTRRQSENHMISKRSRQYIGIVVAVVAYYIIHEGAHLMVALLMGAFKQINFIGLGIQIDIYRERLTDTQLGWFCLVGALSTFVVAWILVLMSRRICTSSSPVFKATMWYVTLALLLLDPLYLSVLYGFFGGGDMNGIRLLLPETAVRIGFAVIVGIHLLVIWKYLQPKYSESFQKHQI